MLNAMWRPTMFLLCLISALSGTPLRQAEAASDFAREIGEFGHSDAIETIDGGVGDDQEVSILKAGGDTFSLAAMTLVAITDIFLPPPLSASPLPTVDVQRGPDLSPRLGAGSHRR